MHHLIELLIIVGILAIVIGVGMLHIPSALITLGLLSTFWGYILLKLWIKGVDKDR